MSKLSSSLASYSDVKAALDAAAERGSIIVELPTIGKAINFKQRANMYRNKVRAQLQEDNAGLPGYHAETIYDTFEIKFAPPFEQKNTSRRVLIQPRELGKLIDPETGEEIKL